MFLNTALAFANHLLDGAAWARARLKPFAGQVAALRLGPISARFAVDGGGFLAVSQGETIPPAVTIELPGDAPLRWLTDRNSLFASARLSGTADFAETLGFVFRNLRWDVEEDLSRVVGDVVAHRLLRTARGVIGWQLSAARRLSHNLSEYLADEQPGLVRNEEMTAFRREVETLRAECDRLENRLQRASVTARTTPTGETLF